LELLIARFGAPVNVRGVLSDDTGAVPGRARYVNTSTEALFDNAQLARDDHRANNPPPSRNGAIARLKTCGRPVATFRRRVVIFTTSVVKTATE
jgi:hypothetical protein